MTQDRVQLSELLEKAGADDIVREMIGFVAQHLIGRAWEKPLRAVPCGASPTLITTLRRQSIWKISTPTGSRLSFGWH